MDRILRLRRCHVYITGPRVASWDRWAGPHGRQYLRLLRILIGWGGK